MIDVQMTSAFEDWLDDLKDRRAQERITLRIARFRRGLMGDVKPVGGGVMEARVDHGPGYRLYYIQRGMELILLLCGGDKSSQARDIAAALGCARDQKDRHDGDRNKTV
jgi:putative addiction module killer protein